MIITLRRARARSLPPRYIYRPLFTLTDLGIKKGA